MTAIGTQIADERPPPTMLVVEDAPRLSFMVATLLENQGWGVVTASNQAEAILLLDQEKALKVMVADVSLGPGPTGVELAQLVHGRWPDVDIIITSGRSILDCPGLPDGALFLAKPYRATELIDLIIFFHANDEACGQLTSSDKEMD